MSGNLNVTLMSNDSRPQRECRPNGMGSTPRSTLSSKASLLMFRDGWCLAMLAKDGVLDEIFDLAADDNYDRFCLFLYFLNMVLRGTIVVNRTKYC